MEQEKKRQWRGEPAQAYGGRMVLLGTQSLRLEKACCKRGHGGKKWRGCTDSVQICTLSSTGCSGTAVNRAVSCIPPAGSSCAPPPKRQPELAGPRSSKPPPRRGVLFSQFMLCIASCGRLVWRPTSSLAADIGSAAATLLSQSRGARAPGSRAAGRGGWWANVAWYRAADAAAVQQQSDGSRGANPIAEPW